MHKQSSSVEKIQWVIWNGSAGLLAMGSMGRIEFGAKGRSAWLAPPFDMVGPFNLDELEAQGRIAFAACIVMSRQRWQDDQVALRREAKEVRRAAHERFNGAWARRHTQHPYRGERQYREALNLPVDGTLEPSQIKAAYRRLARKAHPDVGGSHEQFLRITEARNALLDRAPQ
jgi:hypothetical protein